MDRATRAEAIRSVISSIEHADVDGQRALAGAVEDLRPVLEDEDADEYEDAEVLAVAFGCLEGARDATDFEEYLDALEQAMDLLRDITSGDGTPPGP